MIVIFDGMDKVGKTTLIHALDKATNYEHIIIDRGPVSYKVYDKLYDRGKQLDYFKTEMDLKNTSHLCVYCYADEKDIKKRLEEVGEEFPSEQGRLSDVRSKFNTSAVLSDLNMLYINTSKMSIQKSLELIMSTIEAAKYDFIKLKLKSKSSDYIEYYPSINTFSETMLNSLPSFDPTVDEPYYEMLDASLTHLLHKKDIGWVNHRQLVYTSPDCISTIQIVGGDVTEIFVHQRSLNLSKHKTNDLMFIYDWAKCNLDYTTLFIHYSVGVPHEYKETI